MTVGYIVPTLHASMLMRQGDDDTVAKFERTVVADLSKALRLLRTHSTWRDDVIWERRGTRLWRLFPTVAEVAEFFRGLYEAAQAISDTRLTIDVETTKDSPFFSTLICIGCGYVDVRGEDQVLNIPLLRQGGGPYWTQDEFNEVHRLTWSVFADSRISKMFHNQAFDRAVLSVNALPVNGFCADTMQLHHITDGELPHNLGYLGTYLTDARFWKDDVKGDEGWLNLPDKTLRGYNLADILVTQRIAPILESQVRQLGLWNLYLEELVNVNIMFRATMRGLYVDEAKRSGVGPGFDKKGKPTGLPEGLGPQLLLQRDAAVSALRQISGNPVFDPGSPVQLSDFIFNTLGMPVVKISKRTGKPALDREALMLLELAAHKDMHKAVLQAITSFRRATKLHSTFVEGLKVTGDGHFHPTWKLLAVSGRWTSSPNAQNWPSAVKNIFGSVPGYTYVGVDLSQAELRAIAYLANVSSLQRMYAEDINVHTVNAALLFQLQCPPTLTDNTNPQTDAYLVEQVPKLLGPRYDYSNFQVTPDKQWKMTRTLTKNYIFGKFYGAMDETVHTVLRSKRDPDTNKLLFPNVMLSDIQALSVKVTKQIYPEVPRWWATTEDDTQARGFYACELSGRIRWFRGGFKRNEILNFPVQTLVASWMNKQMAEIQATFDRETGGAALIVQQVHDALNASCPDEYAQRAGEVMREVLSRPIQLQNGTLHLPADAAKVGKNLVDV